MKNVSQICALLPLLSNIALEDSEARRGPGPGTYLYHMREMLTQVYTSTVLQNAACIFCRSGLTQ